MRWAGAVFLGAALGLAAAATDVVAGGIDQTGAWRALDMLLNAGSVWAGLAVLCGWLLLTPGRGAVAGLLGLACAVAGYYAYGRISGDRADVGLGGLSGVIRVWAVAAVFAGPILGGVGALIRRAGVPGLVAALVVPVGTIAEMLLVHHLDLGAFAIDPWLAWTQLGLILLACAGAVLAMLRTLGIPHRVPVPVDLT